MVMGQAITASPAGDGWPVTSRTAPSVSMTSARSSGTRLASRPFSVLPIFFSPLGAGHCLLNDPIRPQQPRRRDGEAERFAGLEVDHSTHNRSVAVSRLHCSPLYARSPSASELVAGL